MISGHASSLLPERGEGKLVPAAYAVRVRSSSSVWMPQVPLRTLITRVPGLRPARTSETSTPAATSRARVASTSATRQLRPHNLSWAWSAPATGRVHHLDDEIAAAEEHQAPFLMRAVERHVEAEPRAIECRGPLRILGGDHDVVEPQDRCGGGRGRTRAFASRVRGKTSARPASARWPRGCASSAAAPPAPRSRLSTRRPDPASAPARSSRRCILAMSLTRKQMLASPSPQILMTLRIRSALGGCPPAPSAPASCCRA